MTAKSPQTLAQKILARAAGRDTVTPGEIVVCKVDLAMTHDSSGPRRLQPMLERLGAKVWDMSKFVCITDHYLPARDEDSKKIIRITRDWAAEHKLANFHDEEGICHVVLPEKGHLRPGLFAVGGDSHSPTGGAFGTYMFGIGATEMLGVVVTGEIWVKVPQTILIEWSGKLKPGVSAKDMMLHLCGRMGMDGAQYQAVQYAGEAVTALSMHERMTLCNMAAEIGAQTGMVAPDAVTRDWLASVGVTGIDTTTWQTDPGAPLGEHQRHDASALAPQVAAPHSPANASAADGHASQKVHVAYIGACTGAKLDDLRMAASVLRGKRVAPGVTLMVGAASLRDQKQAEAEGTLAALVEAGAQLLPNACGACAGYGSYTFDAGTVVISSTARNFRGRMGSPESQVWLGSPYTVAASAVTGHITDPREVLQ
jgi:3-isopropylmalate/(R)-2-methylmalate dehydratase large subunit